jgi:hypothetical protein
VRVRASARECGGIAGRGEHAWKRGLAQARRRTRVRPSRARARAVTARGPTPTPGPEIHRGHTVALCASPPVGRPVSIHPPPLCTCFSLLSLSRSPNLIGRVLTIKARASPGHQLESRLSESPDRGRGYGPARGLSWLDSDGCSAGRQRHVVKPNRCCLAVMTGL